METRKITVVSSRTQKKSVFNSEASTLAELKQDLRNNSIDYDGMTFYEGTSKTELKTDDSVLPHDVPYKGTITNDLVFMLSTTDKKIKSGMMSERRLTVCNDIKKLKLQDVVQNKFGKNFTNCKTEDLEAVVAVANKKVHTKSDTTKKEAVENQVAVAPVDVQARQAIMTLLDLLIDNNIFFSHEVNRVRDILGDESCTKPVPQVLQSSYSDEEVNDMFAFVR